jgi:hypothetical protein
MVKLLCLVSTPTVLNAGYVVKLLSLQLMIYERIFGVDIVGIRGLFKQAAKHKV